MLELVVQVQLISSGLDKLPSKVLKDIMYFIVKRDRGRDSIWPPANLINNNNNKKNLIHRTHKNQAKGRWIRFPERKDLCK